MSPRNAQTEWARTLVDGLIRGGIRRVVVSPGSRSTPIVCALLERTELELHDAIDERCGAFFALGQARIAGDPTAVICTSGSAGANYFPAVVEATASGVPLLALTADRPAELQACGANQTIDQQGLFGRHVVGAFELPPAGARTETLDAVHRLMMQACATSRGPRPGAVHVNARAHKPLEPSLPQTPDEQQLADYGASLRAQSPVRMAATTAAVSDHQVAALAETCRRSSRGVIVCGPGPRSQRGWLAAVAALSKRCGYPVLADATSQLRLRPRAGGHFIDHHPLLLGSAATRARGAPEMVLQLGRPPIAGAWERLLREHPPREHWVVGGSGWDDPSQRATARLPGDAASVLERLVAALPEHPNDPAWTREWVDRSRRAATAVRELRARRDRLHEIEVAPALVGALDDGAALVVGNSLPVRHLDAFCTGGEVDLHVVHQRGASGIDGLLSGAVGVASLHRPTTLLIGDVSLAHDLGALALLARTQHPLRVVVLDNGGGRIFEHLPVAAAGRVPSLDHWLTPPRIDFEAVALAHGIAATTVRSRDALHQALARPVDRPSLIRALVEPDDGAHAAALAEQLAAAAPGHP